MDQDFHYYGTYYAAKSGGFGGEEATLIARAANFIDFCTEKTYEKSWSLVNGKTDSGANNVVAELDNPRYTFQAGLRSSGFSPQDGLWCSFHFLPGNYNDPPETPGRKEVHGADVAEFLSDFQTRDTKGGKKALESNLYLLTKFIPGIGHNYKKERKKGKRLLTRPQSALSRQLIMDAIRCATDPDRLKAILDHAAGGKHIHESNHRKFGLILLGVRAHVVADTWAHQDFCGLNNVLNTYWDVDGAAVGRQAINYDDGTTSGWAKQVLDFKHRFKNANLEAVPNGTSYLGHGWMGHLPDFSFVKYQYKPCWADPSEGPVERNNPEEYRKAWVELVSLFSQASGKGQLILDNDTFRDELRRAAYAIDSSSRLKDSRIVREFSAAAWQRVFSEADEPAAYLDVLEEPHADAVLDGKAENCEGDGSDCVDVNSDLYLFQIAADYHFHFVKNYLERHGIYTFTSSWSEQTGALSEDVSELFDEN